MVVKGLIIGGWGVAILQNKKKKKLKSEIFNDKKDYKQQYFSLS